MHDKGVIAMKRVECLVVLSLAFLTLVPNAFAQSTGQMYWIDNLSNNIERADLDGSNPEVYLNSPLGEARDIAIDAAVGKVYWTEFSLREIRRANFNGSAPEVVLSWVSAPEGIALDVTSGKVYWSSRSNDQIERADLDGNNQEVVVSGLSDPYGIAVDAAGGKLYWANSTSATIQRANLDGSNPEGVVTTGLTRPWDVALDTVAGKIYWTDTDAGKIQRADLDGSNVEDVRTGENYPETLAIDVSGGKVYWSGSSVQAVRRSNLDGSNIEEFLTALSNPSGLDLDTSAGKLYVSDRSYDKIVRSNLDGSSAEDAIVGLNPQGIAPDFLNGYLYRTDFHGNIYRTTVGGTILDDRIVEGLGHLGGITLDVAGGKMYWGNLDAGQIQRANLDGSGVESVVSGVSPNHLVLDAADRTVYWTSSGDNKIQRVNTDGTGLEDLIVGPNGFRAYAINFETAKMYWSISNNDTIWTASLDGSDVQTVVVPGAQLPRGLAIETGDDQIYLTEDLGRIMRANLDGSGAVTLVSGLRSAGQIVLGLETMTPTTLAWSRAVPAKNGVEISWGLAETESHTVFELWRAEAPAWAFRAVSGAAIAIDGGTYRALDTSVEPGGSYRYRVDIFDDESRRVLFETEAVTTPRPEFSLEQNWPNPFNPTTHIVFQLPEPMPVRLSVFDPEGKLVVTLFAGTAAPGRREVMWRGTDADGRPVSSGIYFYRLQAGKQVLTKKMLLLK